MSALSTLETPYDLPLRQAASEVQRGDRPAPDLLRALMGWRTWRVPGYARDAGIELGVLTTPEGGRILEVFSDEAAILAFNATAEELLHPGRLTLLGADLFALAAQAQVDSVNIDTFNPHAFKYRGAAQLASLGRWAARARVELALYRPDEHPDPFTRMRDFSDWHLVSWEDDEGADRVLAPDDRGRNLMALFTAEDTAQAFIAQMEEDTGESGFSAEGGHHGAALFAELSRLPLDGLVINPLGPLPARALAAAAQARLVG